MALKVENINLEDSIIGGTGKLLEIIRGETPDRVGIVRKLPASYIPSFNLGGILGADAGGLLRVPHTDYYLEIYYYGDLLTSIAFPYNPMAYVINRTENVSLTHTVNRVFRETSLNRIRNIAFEGLSGYETRLGYARDGGYIFENGEVIMHEFEEFLNSYNYLSHIFSSNQYAYTYNQARFNKNFGSNKDNTLKSGLRASSTLGLGNAGQSLNPYGYNPFQGGDVLFLVLRCVNENVSFKVEVSDFSYSKNTASNKFGYRYNITFNSYGLFGTGKRDNIFLDTINQITGYINKANTALAILQALFINTSEDYILPLSKPINAISSVLDNLQTTIESAGIITGAVAEVANNAINLFQKFDNEVFTTNNNIFSRSANNLTSSIKSQYKSIKDNAYNDINRKNAARENAKRNISDQIDLETIQIALGLDSNKNSVAIDSKNIDAVLGMLKNVDYDNLDENKLVELGLIQSLMNSLRYNFEGIKSIVSKDYIKISRSNDKETEFTNDTNVIRGEDFLYKIYTLRENEDLRDVARKINGNSEDLTDLLSINGWLDARRKGDGSFAVAGDVIKIRTNKPDLLFSNNIYYTDLNVPYDDLIISGNDISLVTGIKNLQQSIKNNFLTYQNELEVDLYGLADIIGARNIEVIKETIKNKLLVDPRIKNINIKDVKIEQDQLLISLNVTGIDNQTLEFLAPINNS